MGKLLEELRHFLSTATKEQLEQAWKEVEPFKDVGPTITEYIKNMEEIKEAIAKSIEYIERMNNTPIPKIEGDKAICPCCGAEVKRGRTIMLSRPPVYTYYCTRCLYTKEHRTFDPIVNCDSVSDNTDNR